MKDRSRIFHFTYALLTHIRLYAPSIEAWRRKTDFVPINFNGNERRRGVYYQFLHKLQLLQVNHVFQDNGNDILSRVSDILWNIFAAMQWITKTFTIYYANYVALIVFSIKYSLLVHAIFVSHDIAQQIKKSGAPKKKNEQNRICVTKQTEDSKKLRVAVSKKKLWYYSSRQTYAKMVNQCTRLNVESTCDNMNCVCDNENNRAIHIKYMLFIFGSRKSKIAFTLEIATYYFKWKLYT